MRVCVFIYMSMFVFIVVYVCVCITLQLKINDLENSLEHQRCVNDGLQENVDVLTGQLRELESSYNDEMIQHRNTRAKLDK